MTNNENLISLLVAKELEIKEMLLYIKQLEESYIALNSKYAELQKVHYAKKKRNLIGFKQ